MTAIPSNSQPRNTGTAIGDAPSNAKLRTADPDGPGHDYHNRVAAARM
jgi:hypothetical protein